MSSSCFCSFSVLLIFLSAIHIGMSDIESDRSALLALRSSVRGRLSWNATGDPCKWVGVTCDNNRVTALKLPGVGLRGEIPVGIFGNLTSLRTLSLRRNSLSGSIPIDLGKCVNLRSLFLQQNQFSNGIPDTLFELRLLIRLNLGENQLTGEISPGFKNLTRLKSLFLERNRLSGSIPDLGLRFEQFNASFNSLNGSIPSFLRNFKSDSFIGNSLCGAPLDSCTVNEDSPVNTPSPGSVVTKNGSKNRKKKLSGGAIAGIVIGSVAGIGLIIFVILFCCRPVRRNGSAQTRSIETQVSMDKVVVKQENGSITVARNHAAENGIPNKNLFFFGRSEQVFNIEELLQASAEVLGKGVFGTTYKAVFGAGTAVVVKRLKEVKVQERDFREKIESIGSVTHENLVPLKAYFYGRDEKLLVYDYVPMGSLSALLHGTRGTGRTPLNWETRTSIALDVACGLAYLHSRGSTMVHCNISSSNILLTQEYSARVADFGLAHLSSPSPMANCCTVYRAPESTKFHLVTQKGDVYSFGVLLLELLTGKVPVTNDDGFNLPQWVRLVDREEWVAEVFDIELLRYQNVEAEMVEMMQLAIDCTDRQPESRPRMEDVVQRIENLRSNSYPGQSDSTDDRIKTEEVSQM